MPLLIELQYFPPVKSYSTLINYTDIVFSLYENYQRRSFRNRCILAGANGLISLTVPIMGGRSQKKIFSDVRIDYSSDWQQQHWRTIFSAYGKSPWFFHYAESLENLYSQKVDLLADWNRVCLDWVNDALGFDIKLLESPGTFGKWGDFWKVGGLLESGSEFQNTDPVFNHPNSESEPKTVLMDWRNRFLPANFQDPNLGPFPVYTQVFEERLGFQPDLSILDFVLCCGKGQNDKLR